MSGFVTIAISAKVGDHIRVSASAFTDNEVQVQLTTKAKVEAFRKSEETDDDPVILEATAMTTLKPDTPEWIVDVPTTDEWHIVFQPWRANVSASRIPKQ